MTAGSAHAMTGLGGLAGLGVIYAGALAVIVLVVASALAGARHLPWGVAGAVTIALLLFATIDGGSTGHPVFGIAVIASLVATCWFLVLGYRRPGSFLRRVVGVALLRPSAFREGADAPGSGRRGSPS